MLHEGRVVWVLEAMTASRFFPLARPFDTPAVSYVRNSAKVTVDAVTGEIHFYAVPLEDPLRDAYAAAFPGLFKPLDEMPAGIRQHLRYARSLMAIQARVLLDYHQESPAVFFGRQDVWASPQELAEGSAAVAYQPEYGLLRLPGDAEPGFHLTTTFVPAGRQNLTGLLAGQLDDAGAPTLRLFDIPVENQVAILWAATNGMLDEIAVEDVQKYEKAYLEYLTTNKASTMDAVREQKKLTDEVVSVFREAAKVVAEQFKQPAAV